MSKVKNKKGFTLIELVVVMAIIAVLAALMVGAIIAARKQATETQIVGDSKGIETALESYSARNQGKYIIQTTVGTIGSNASLVPTYLTTTPTQNAKIQYISNTDGSSYTLVACPNDKPILHAAPTAGTVPSGNLCRSSAEAGATTPAVYVTAR